MEPDNCTRRLTAALDEEFHSCHGLVAGALAGLARRGSFEPWEMRMLVSAMRTTAQLASTIGKLQAKTAAENSENRGSIQQ